MENNRYYVYIYLNQTKPGIWLFKDHVFNYQPFYVGKGVNDREIEHLRPYQLKKKTVKSSVIKSIFNKTGEQPIHYRLYVNLNELDAVEIEKEIIKHFGRIDTNTGILTNGTDGGDGANNFSEETKKRIGKSNSKKVYQYTLDGIFLREWCPVNSIDLENTSNISTAIKRNGTFSGYIWSYEYNDNIKSRIKYQMPIKYKKIKQIDIITGVIINIFETALEIEKELNLRDGARNKIYYCLNGKLKTAYGYKWEI